MWKKRVAILSRLLKKYFFRLLGTGNRFIRTQQHFNIKTGYSHAGKVIAFDDTNNKDEWQKEVYELARDISVEKNYRSIIDVGCGSAFKLLNVLGGYDTIGIEIEPTYGWLCKEYPDRHWLLFNELDPETVRADLVICSDVIEHIDNPDTLLLFLKNISFKQLLISTPERDGVAGKGDYGPPENPAHYREWNAVEFKNYIEKWFQIEEQRIFNTQTSTQVIIAKKKNI
jgi:hypothetical protein